MNDLLIEPMLLEEIDSSGVVVQNATFLPYEFFAYATTDSSGNTVFIITASAPVPVRPY